MPPSLRADLEITPPQGSTELAYSVRQPHNGRVVRLGAVELWMAQQLDGSRRPAQILQQLQRTQGVLRSDDDFSRLLSQLRGAGMLEDPQAMRTEGALPLSPLGGEAEGSGATLSVARPTATADADLRPALAPSAPPRAATTGSFVAEGSRPLAPPALALVVATLTQVRRGELPAALTSVGQLRRMLPDDTKVVRLHRALRQGSQGDATEQVESVWHLCQQLYPSLATQVVLQPPSPPTPPGGPGVLPGSLSARLTGDLLRRPERPGRRPLWALVIGVLCTFAVVGLVRRGHLGHRGGSPRAVEVQTQRLQEAQVPLYYVEPAVDARLAEDVGLAFASPGVVAAPVPKLGAQVVAGEVIAALVMRPAQQRAWERSKAAAQAARSGQSRAVHTLDQLLSERHRREVGLAAAQRSVAQIGAKTSRSIASRARARLAQQRRGLLALAQRERAGRAALAQAIHRRDTASANLARLQRRLRRRLLVADFAGEIYAVSLREGARVAAGEVLVRVREPTVARLKFVLPASATVRQGERVQVSAHGATPQPATAVAVARGPKGLEVDLSLVLERPGARAAAAELPPPAAQFRMVKEVLKPAYLVNPSAILGESSSPEVLLLKAGVARAVPVRIVEGHDGLIYVTAVAEATPRFGHPARIIVRRLDGLPLSELRSGMPVIVSNR